MVAGNNRSSRAGSGSFSRSSGIAACLLSLLISGRAGADTELAPASTGNTQIASDGFEAAAEPEDAPSPDANHLRLSAGGLLTTGNSRTLALTLAADHRLRRGDSQLTLLAAVNYGMAAHAPDAPYRTSIENAQGRVRYDHFVLDGLAAFLGVTVRRDRFQGLALRVNVDPGVAYYFIDEKAERLWAELGYDLQHDLRHDSVLDATGGGETNVDVRETRHNSRLFAGYDTHLNERFSLSTGLELLRSFEDGFKWRVNGDAALNVHLGGHFSLAVTLVIKHDNHPLPEVQQTDTTSALNLVYTL